MNSKPATFLPVLLALIFSVGVRAGSTPLAPEALLAAAVVDACRLAHLRLGGEPDTFDAERVEVHPSIDAVGAMDAWLPDSRALDLFARFRAVGLPSPWIEFVDARHARRILEAHYR